MKLLLDPVQSLLGLAVVAEDVDALVQLVEVVVVDSAVYALVCL